MNFKKILIVIDIQIVFGAVLNFMALMAGFNKNVRTILFAWINLFVLKLYVSNKPSCWI